MSDRLAAHWPPTIRNLSTRTRRYAIGTAAVIPALLIGVLGSTHHGAPQDSGLVACAYPLSTQDVSAADYRKIRAEFAGSHWPDLRTDGKVSALEARRLARLATAPMSRAARDLGHAWSRWRRRHQARARWHRGPERTSR